MQIRTAYARLGLHRTSLAGRKTQVTHRFIFLLFCCSFTEHLCCKSGRTEPHVCHGCVLTEASSQLFFLFFFFKTSYQLVVSQNLKVTDRTWGFFCLKKIILQLYYPEVSRNLIGDVNTFDNPVVFYYLIFTNWYCFFLNLDFLKQLIKQIERLRLQLEINALKYTL